MAQPAGHLGLALRDRAHAFLVASGGSAPEAVLLNHVYAGQAPTALHASLRRPLLGDPRLVRRSDGEWAVVTRSSPAPESGPALPLGILALAVTGPRPARGRIVHVAALHVAGAQVLERLSLTVCPGARVPRYVAERLGLERDGFDDLEPFAAVLDDLERFLAARPVVAQDARLTWSFVDAEARRLGRTLPARTLIDANDFFSRALALPGKPGLASVAAHVGVGAVRIERPDEEVRVLAAVVARVLDEPSGVAALRTLLAAPATAAADALQHASTARALPEQPGVYVLRGADQQPLYVGKARSLRTRLGAYVHRPLGATRRLEGLVGSVDAVDPTLCHTDLEALVLEDRQIRRMQPRFNTVRQQRTPRLWIRLPPLTLSDGRKRPRAARRLEPSRGPTASEGEFVGPFRNEAAAERARGLTRAVFDLDARRRQAAPDYEARLAQAWQFLHGEREAAEAYARATSVRLLREVLAFDVAADLLPADPRLATYVLVRATSEGVEGFRLERGIFRAHATLGAPDLDPLEDVLARFAADVMVEGTDRTTPEDVDVVLRWIGAQRPPARLVCLPADHAGALEAIMQAVRSARPAAPNT